MLIYIAIAMRIDALVEDNLSPFAIKYVRFLNLRNVVSPPLYFIAIIISE